jgi:hypothetical protein
VAFTLNEDFSSIDNPEGLRAYLDHLRDAHNHLSALERTVGASLRAAISVMGEPDSPKIAKRVTGPIIHMANLDDSAAKSANLAWRRAVQLLIPKPVAASGLAGKPFKR